MDSGNSQRRTILYPVKQIIENLKKNGRIITVVPFILLCIGGAIVVAIGVVMNVQKADNRRGDTGLSREDVMIVIGACIMVIAMYFWY